MAIPTRIPPDVSLMTATRALQMHPRSRKLAAVPGSTLVLVGRYRLDREDWPKYIRDHIDALVGGTTYQWSAWTLKDAD